MFKNVQIPLFDFIASMSRVVDLMDSAIMDHHLRVAYGALRLAEEMGLPPERRRNVALAGMLHDIGAFSSRERLNLLEFEVEKPHAHAEAGYLLLQTFKPFEPLALPVRHHHVAWDGGNGETHNGSGVPVESHILNLADRVAVLLKRDAPVLRQATAIQSRIQYNRGVMFSPEVADAFDRLAQREYFWLELTSPALSELVRRGVRTEPLELTLEELAGFSQLICRLIDFKSAFTATHSSGVAAVAEALAARVGFSEREQVVMRIAAHLHDLGKLAIPSEILEKPANLTDEEQCVMRSHVYYTYEVLAQIEGFEVINEWSALHQERIDGTGYPFHFGSRDLSLGARVMAVADVFTAITEDRPYRDGLPREKALPMLDRMGKQGHLDAHVTERLVEHFDAINAARADAQKKAAAEYQQFAQMLA